MTWAIIKEKREFRLPNGQVDEYEAIGIQREDGLTVTREGAHRDGQDETFLCKASFGEFKFTANRWDEMAAKPLDQYTVYLHTYIKGRDLELCKTYAEDVQDALLHFPIFRAFNDVPVREVVFEVGDPRNHKVVNFPRVGNKPSPLGGIGL